MAVALNTHGTRAVQKLIETLTNREQVRLWQLASHALSILGEHCLSLATAQASQVPSKIGCYQH